MAKRPPARPPQHNRAAFGERLRRAIDSSPKSREAVAQDLGLHTNTVSNWIRAETDCAVGWLPTLATSLHIPLAQLVDGASATTAAAPPAPATPLATSGPQATEKDFARQVVEVLERPLTAPDLMTLLAEAKRRAK